MFSNLQRNVIKQIKIHVIMYEFEIKLRFFFAILYLWIEGKAPHWSCYGGKLPIPKGT
jgi:hypothetical protein